MHGTEDEVDSAAVQGVEQLSDQASPQGEGDAWVVAVKLRQRPGQIQRSQDSGGADAQSPAQHGGHLVQVGARAVELIEHSAYSGVEELAGVGERDTPGGAIEQHHAQLGLEPPDLRGHSRLRNVEVFGGPGEPAAADDGVEIHELPQLHQLRMIDDKCKRKRVLDLSAVSGHPRVVQRRHLGSDGLVTSALGLGCMGLSQGYGTADDDRSIATIRRALELGVELLDTAMSYGRGHNEGLIGRALAGHAGPVTLATKFGIVRDEHGVRLDGRPEHVRGYCEESLARLGVEVIDLYYLHRVDPGVPIAETIGAMAGLVEAGKVRHLGLSEVTVGQLEQADAVHRITAVQLEWSLLWREPEDDIVPAAHRLGVGLVPYSPLGRGLLTAALAADEIDASDFRRSDPRFHGENLDRNRAQVDALREIADELGATSGQLALAWLLGQGPDIVPIPGTRDAGRIEENAAAAGLQLSAADLRRLDRVLPRSAWAGDRQSFAVPVTTRSAS